MKKNNLRFKIQFNSCRQLSSYWQDIYLSRNCKKKQNKTKQNKTKRKEKSHVNLTKIVIYKVLLKFLDQLLLPYKFHGISI